LASNAVFTRELKNGEGEMGMYDGARFLFDEKALQIALPLMAPLLAFLVMILIW
jgi:hypothetical protein